MEYIEVSIRDEYIRLGQAMKLAGLLSMGSDIKYEIMDGNVKVNGEVEERRGRKLHKGDVFSYAGQEYKIV
ncbi:MAG TPA: RNA-binding S4 domain-containing protein [Candidatus Merdisoma merdipullorum]|nr:RNA-binding S4 domain-containing protein [Candidatus Merdisoma merdipullorum]